jgi:hypothetical protein
MPHFYLPPAESMPPDCVIVWNGAIERDTVVAAQRQPECRSCTLPTEPLPPATRSTTTFQGSHKAHFRWLLSQLALGATFTTRTFAPDAGIPRHLITLYSSQAVAAGRLRVTGWQLREEGGGLLRRYRVVALVDRPVAPRRPTRWRRSEP